MDRLKQEIEDARKEQAEIKNKQKWAMDSWVKLTKEMTALPSGHADLKKKERDCENAAQLVKQLNENLAQNEAVLQRLSQNLLFFFEENLQGVVVTSKKPRTESVASGAPEPTASSVANGKESGKDASNPAADSGLNAFRKNILGYCHKSHGVGEDIEVWREKLPKLLKRAEKRLPKDKVESFQKILSNMNSTDEVQKKLIIWYVDAFPNERKPLGYYEAAGVAPPKKKSSGKKTEGEERETKESAPSATKLAKSTQSTATPSTAKASSSTKKQQAPASPSSSSSSDDDSSSEKSESSSSSSSSEEEEVQKKKTPQTKAKPAAAEESSKKKKEEELKKKDKKEETASSKKKPKVEEESEEEEKDKKKHHNHHKKSAVLDALTASGKKGKA